MNIEDLFLRDICTSGEEFSITSDDMVLFLLQGTALKKINYDELAKAIIEQYNKSLLAGSNQSVQQAINGLTQNITTNATNIGTLRNDYNDLTARVATNEGNIDNLLKHVDYVSMYWVRETGSAGIHIASSTPTRISVTPVISIGQGNNSKYFESTTYGFKFKKTGRYLQFIESLWANQELYSSNLTLNRSKDGEQIGAGATARDNGGTDNFSCEWPYVTSAFVNEEMVFYATHGNTTSGGYLIGAKVFMIPLFVAS